MDRSRARKHFPGVQCATGNVVFHSSSDGNPISINNQGVAALYHEHILIEVVNMGGRGSGLGACPKRHLTAVRAVEHVTLNALSCLIRLCDPVERMFHEFRKVVHGCNPTHLNRPTQSPAVTGASAGFRRTGPSYQKTALPLDVRTDGTSNWVAFAGSMAAAEPARTG